MNETPTSRYERGIARLTEVVGSAGLQVIDALQQIASDMARYTIEFSYGDLYGRRALDDCSRQIAAVAALAALGHCRPQLKVHINGALNVGCTPVEIVEVILQMVLYAGFPVATNAMLAAHEVFEERGCLAALQTAGGGEAQTLAPA
ncbi:carboxymuconolactone decarboxylase family protein [Paraburkholderia lacunae]|uniref:4-carboxymuconolactone decarboxylase n=1 Tax=Paraburkholderia lacunae TaxID=2211104 RepID=A0A370NAW9_9BURK|nr:carboxymuconolactone decarboxylase family protein [Paraburkholderia lacunae]RDK02739.1 4-carboxymuconolactone decarboxylase [Paraburkholderia lacunae]